MGGQAQGKHPEWLLHAKTGGLRVCVCVCVGLRSSLALLSCVLLFAFACGVCVFCAEGIGKYAMFFFFRFGFCTNNVLALFSYH